VVSSCVLTVVGVCGCEGLVFVRVLGGWGVICCGLGVVWFVVCWVSGGLCRCRGLWVSCVRVVPASGVSG
jgi:hypothetical protein